MSRSEKQPAVPRLRANDWVEVRSAPEIFATLDETGALDGLPFMPEMLQFCGRRYRVEKSAHKTCDTVASYVIRRMSDAVHLADVRCDGEGHDGCQARCLIYWKSAWLKPVDGPATDRAADGARSLDSGALERLQRAARIAVEGEPELRYRCQATDLLKATQPVSRRQRWDPRFYVQDLTSRNVSLGEFIYFGTLAAFHSFMRWATGRPYPQLCGTAGAKTPSAMLNLQPGELVDVRTKEEILQTLNKEQRNRGLWFDLEMVPYCGERDVRVLAKVEKIVDEKTGRMLKIPGSCHILEGVTCKGMRSATRMFCSRGIYPYWREIWLSRSTGAAAGVEGKT
jgi:hypothetical protein